MEFTVSVGAELSLFMSGIVEGGTIAARMEQLLAEASAPRALVAEDLNEHLRARSRPPPELSSAVHSRMGPGRGSG